MYLYPPTTHPPTYIIHPYHPFTHSWLVQQQLNPPLPLYPPTHPPTQKEMDPAMVEAIQAIKFAGKNFRQLAEQAKTHGNDLFKWGKKNPAQYSNCLKSYQEAEAYAREIPVLGGEEEDEDKCLSKEEKARLLSQIYANRAMAHLHLKNYRSCKQDCDRSLRHEPGTYQQEEAQDASSSSTHPPTHPR